MASNKTLFGVIMAVVVVTVMVIAELLMISDSSPGKKDVAIINEDYWFEILDDGPELLYTSDGWTFELNIRQSYTLEKCPGGFGSYQ